MSPTPPPSHPLVSVVVPTFDQLRFLREAVKSVVSQSYANWELLIVDGGSTDGTSAWVASLPDPRIRLLSLPSSDSAAHARNVGIREAKGDYLAFLNSDDCFERDKIEAQLGALRQGPERSWSYTAVTNIDAEGQLLFATKPTRWRAVSGWVLEEILRYERLVHASTVMVRRDLIERVGLLDESLHASHEYDLFVRFAAAGEVQAIERPLTRKRIITLEGRHDRVDKHESQILICERFAARSPIPEVRRLCEEEARRHRLSAAATRGSEGDTRLAMAHLLPALRARPLSPKAWTVLGVEIVGRGILMPAARRLMGRKAG
jgi:glycosyltransferase involved in cell wall biosynthesis